MTVMRREARATAANAAGGKDDDEAIEGSDDVSGGGENDTSGGRKGGEVPPATLQQLPKMLPMLQLAPESEMVPVLRTPSSSSLSHLLEVLGSTPDLQSVLGVVDEFEDEFDRERETEHFISDTLPTALPTKLYRTRCCLYQFRRVDFIHTKGDLSSITLTEENGWVSRARSPQTLHERDGLENLDIQDFDTQRAAPPISRARNPFLRHPSYYLAISGISNFSQSSPPITSALPMSPADVPLSVPTPDELVKLY
ncbi:hypothetical protein EV702DRAFT_1048542 [Suillus placidus]|uniref:Uncharacterized protein n=1 Tax=Suillus placidus TaxID=48579 RepID=A0A9P6ZML0_9AGAM|nr:hypothetical protein EV702DRAFT_1048542 [Suillus placidus]